MKAINIYWQGIACRKRYRSIIIVSGVILYLYFAFTVFLPACRIEWEPLGTNEFVFCFLLPPALIGMVYLVYRIKSLSITLIVSFIGLVAMVGWFGQERFFVFFISPDWIFWDCVHLLNVLGNVFGLSYSAINVLIFCLIEPLIFIFMLWYIFHLKKQIKKLKIK